MISEVCHPKPIPILEIADGKNLKVHVLGLGVVNSNNNDLKQEVIFFLLYKRSLKDIQGLAWWLHGHWGPRFLPSFSFAIIVQGFQPQDYLMVQEECQQLQTVRRTKDVP